MLPGLLSRSTLGLLGVIRENYASRYISLTKIWALRYFVLEISRFMSPHIGEAFAIAMMDIFEKCGIKENFMAITSDNASDILRVMGLHLHLSIQQKRISIDLSPLDAWHILLIWVSKEAIAFSEAKLEI